MSVREITGGFTEALQSAGNKLVVVDFFAAWYETNFFFLEFSRLGFSSFFVTQANSVCVLLCFLFVFRCGPCQMIAPFVEELARKYPTVVFLKVNEASNKDVLASCGVRSFPTFHFYIAKNKVDELVGADPSGLEQRVIHWMGQVFDAFSGEGASLGGSVSRSAEEMKRLRLQRLAAMNSGETHDTSENMTCSDGVCVPVSFFCYRSFFFSLFSPSPLSKENREDDLRASLQQALQGKSFSYRKSS